MIFSISTNMNKTIKINESSFTTLKIWERQHIEAWIRKNPEMLGENLLIVSTEFSSFSNSKDRLDVLADEAGFPCTSYHAKLHDLASKVKKMEAGFWC